MKRGFTLIELLVVIAIIAILTGLILPSILSSKPKARDAERVSDISQLQLALELYYDRCGTYPSVLDTTTSTCTSGGTAVNMGMFISQIPTSPAGTGQNYGYAVASGGGTLTTYVLHAQLELSGNPAIAKGLSGMPSPPSGYNWTTSFTCGNTSASTNYCVGPQ